MDGFGVAVAGQPCGESIGPGVAGFGREQDKLTNRDDAPMAVSRPALDVADLVGEAKVLPLHHLFARSTPDRLSIPAGYRGDAMDLFTKLFGDFLVFVYHCFDRIVIRGYLTALSRPELVVHFFREIVGVAEVSKEALSQRTADYQNWVEAYARNHAIAIEWAEKGARKEDHVLPWLRRMEKRNAYVSTSSSRAWSKGRPSASACRSTRPRTRTTALPHRRAPAQPLHALLLLTAVRLTERSWHLICWV